MAEPDLFAAAISELGYDARPSAREQSEKAVSKQPLRVSVPTGAPKFFVDAMQEAGASQRPVVIDFWAEWCVACLQLKRQTLEHPEVVKALGSAELVYVDLDKYPNLGEAYGVATIPDVFFIDKSGRIVDRLQNFEPPEAFVARIRKAFGQPLNRHAGDK